jgi:hypothetical protein
MIESMNGGAFLSLMGDLAYKALDKMSNSSQVWDFTSCRDKSTRIPKKRGIYELKGETEMNIKIDALTKRLNAPLHWYFPSTRWNKRTLSMITESSQLDLTLRCIIQDGGTIQTFHGSKIREAPQNAKTQYLPGFQAQQHNQPTSQVPASSPQSALEETMRTFIQSNGQLIQELQKSTMINSQAI